MKQSKIMSLQYLRTFAFLGIFFRHTGSEYGISTGAWGVSVFLILSGFLMSINYHSRDLGATSLSSLIRFGYRKISKLYFLHIVTLVAVLPFFLKEVFSLVGLDRIMSLCTILTNALLLQTWNCNEYLGTSINASWYLSTILLCYILTPLFLKLLKKIRPSYIISCLCIVGLFFLQSMICFGLYCLVENNTISIDNYKWFVYFSPYTRWIDYFIGMMLGDIYICRSETCAKVILNKGKLLVLGSCVIAILINFLSYEFKANTWWSSSVIYTLSTVLLIFVFASVKFNGESKTSKGLVHLGDISGEAYLIHFVVLRYLDSVLNSVLGNADIHVIVCIKFFLGLVITIILSEVWRMVKNRIDRRVNKNRS